jgi:hypothetical protein
MADAKKSGEFSFNATSVAYVMTEGGGGANHINLEGTATGFGEVLGTLSLFGDAPMAQSGPASWVGTAYLDNGDVVESAGEGFFERSSKHKWRVRSIMRGSTGAVYVTDGVISLKGRTYKGTMTPFD